MIKHILEHEEFPVKCFTLLKIGEAVQNPYSAVWSNVLREEEYAENKRVSALVKDSSFWLPYGKD